MNRFGVVFDCVLFLLASGGLAIAQPPGPLIGYEVIAPPSGSPDPRYVGSSSCMAANCHAGADRPRVSAGDAWSPVAAHMWRQNDPHAESYGTLLTAESRRMVEKLGGGAPAHRRADCLACHAPEGTAPLAEWSRSSVADGVGCEACHGPAERWVGPHQYASWHALPAAAKEQYGFRDLDNLAVRSRACADCHVGSPGGLDVNHDLIAAGHPRLLFEMSALHARYPKHWRDEREGKATLDAKLWAVGRATAAAASLALLAERAADRSKAWPEFAEYDCYACHHSLADDKGRQLAARRPGVAPGSLPFNRWNYTLLEAAMLGGGRADRGASLSAIEREMSRPLPTRGRVAALAGRGGSLLAGDARQLADEWFDHGRVAVYLHELSRPAPDASSWDAAAQRLLGLSAMHYSDVASGAPSGAPAVRRRRASLLHLRDLLKHGGENDSSRYNSPRDWNGDRRHAVDRQFEAIHSSLSGAP